MVINKKYELQFNFFVCSWIDVEWRKGSWDWEMRLSNKQMEVKSIFGNVGGYISGPTSNGMTQDTSDRESAQIRRYHLVICLPRCHGNTIATSHWLNLWERCRLNRYKVAGRRSSVRLYILFTWPYFWFMFKKKNQRTSSSCFGEQVLVVHVRDSFVVNESVATDPSPNAHQWAPTPALNSLWPFQTQLSIRCVVFSESTIREYCRDHVVGRQMIQLLVCSRRKWTGGFFILAWHFLRVRDSVRLMVKAWESRQGRDCWQPWITH